MTDYTSGIFFLFGLMERGEPVRQQYFSMNLLAAHRLLFEIAY
jgi:hypothetical protein